MGDWVSARLGDIVEVASGGTPSLGEPGYWNGDIPWISGASLTSSRLRTSDRMVTPLAVGNGTRIASRGSTLLLVRGMSLHKEIRVGMAMRDVAFNQDVKALASMGRVDPEYLLYSLEGRKSELLSLVHPAGHGTGVLATDQLLALQVELPGLEEQRRIAGVLAVLDEAIETDLALVDALWERARTAFEQASKTASFAPLGDRVQLRYGRALPERNRRPGPFPVVSSAGVVGSHQEALVSGPGVVVGRKGTVGSVTWVEKDFFPIDTAFYVEADMPMAWVYFALRAAGLAEMNTDSAVPGLNRENALSRLMPVPTDEALGQFDRLVQVLFDAARELRAEVEQLTDARDELLPLLMSGKVRVAEAIDAEA